MTTRHARVARIAIAAALALGAAGVGAQAASGPASAARRQLDPGVPPAAALAAAAAEKRSAQGVTGSALDAAVEQQLRGSFDAADVAHLGTLTRAQAQAGGFGYVAQHFDAIDTRHAGAVSFDDLQRYLRARGARYVAK